MGGKQALCSTILQRFPPGFRNKIYVEVFGGGGSILLNKERSVREILNDKNGNLINLYRVVREHPNELKDRLLYVLHSREDFQIAQRRLAEFSYKDDILRAADFYQVIRQSYAGNGHEDYQEIQGEKRPFDERVVIRELLKEMGTPQPQAAP